jgi:hypothetical protein
MAAVNKKKSVHYTLTGAQADVIALNAATDWVEIANRDATAANAVYYTIGSAANPPAVPAVAGDDTFVLVGGGNASRRHRVPGGRDAQIGIIAANASPISAMAVDSIAF